MEANNITVVVPHGAFPKDDLLEQLVEIGLRLIAQKCGKITAWSDNYPEKYGANFENDVFIMHPFCWCDKGNCKYCDDENPAPNFLHKDSGLEIHWYKYIGRSMEIAGGPHDNFITMLLDMIKECLDSIEGEETH